MKWDEAVKEASTRIDLSDREVDDVISIFYDAGFAELARSHAFICTIAAFLESLFSLSLPKVGSGFRGTLIKDHPRVVRFATSTPSFWDPRKPKKDQSGIAVRIGDILAGAGLASYFGSDFGRLTKAIYAYRNKMVHNGYEWDLEERLDFEAQINKEGWSGWFATATSGSEPWFFTMTPSFCEACLSLCNRALLAFDGLLLGDWDRYKLQYGND